MDSQAKPPEEGAGSGEKGEGLASSPESQASNPASDSDERPHVQRRSMVGGVIDGAKFIDDKRTNVHLRPIDRMTSGFLGCGLILLIILLMLPRVPIYVMIVVDLVFFAMLSIFMLCRFGVVRALTPRQAVIVWELIFGATLFGAFIAVHLGFVSHLIAENMAAIR